MNRRYVLRSVAALLVLILVIAFTQYARRPPPQREPDPPYVGPQISPNEQAPGFAPLQEAVTFCGHRRWDVYQTRNKRRKVYDLFLINTELDWLEIRLNELDAEVDYFVILESPITFQRGSKPMHLKDKYDKFRDYHHKIIHRTLDISNANFPEDDNWALEHFTRNALLDQVMLSLSGDEAPEQGDVLLISDVDEIPRPNTIKALRNCAFPPRVTLRSHFYYYSFQWLHRGHQWEHPQATYYNGPEDTVKPQSLRKDEADVDIYNAAWHCSSCFQTMEDLKTKITSFSHKDYNQEYFLDSQRLLSHFRKGEDLFEREGEVYDRMDNNPDLPAFLLNATNRQRFAYMLDRDPVNANFVDM